MTNEILYDPDFEKKSLKEVSDTRIWKTAKRKLDFLAEKGIQYPSLNAKKIQAEKYHGKDIWEFYITKKWRCFFTFDEEKKEILVIRLGNHL